jgi:hypothetical protein
MTSRILSDEAMKTTTAISSPAAASRSRLRVFITSCEAGEGAWTVQAEKLRCLYELSDKRYSLVNDPASADVILITDVPPQQPLPLPQWGKKILEHKLINKYPNTSFSLSHAPYPLILHRGIYTSGVKSIFNLGRVRTGSYALYSDEYLNPYIKGYQFAEHNPIGKEYLLVFIGRSRSSPRWKLRNAIFNLKFERSDIFIENSTPFDLWAQAKDTAETLKRQKRYYDILLRAKFSLCPRGAAANSIRLFESMQLGVAPIIVSDEWRLPRGPRWEEFSILLKERNIKDVEKIVLAHEPAWEQMGYLARKAFETYFADHVYFDYVVDNCVDIMHSQGSRKRFAGV